MDEKYITLLLKKCLKFDKSKSLFVSYDVINKDFANKVKEMAKSMGINDIYMEEKDIYRECDILSSISLGDIDNHPYFNRIKWDEYAKKYASFLLIDSEMPGILDNIESEKIAKARLTKIKTCPIYRKYQLNNIVPWCIAAYPNEVWAKYLFPNDENALEKLTNYIFDMCMVRSGDPIVNWDEYLKSNKKIVDSLNSYRFKTIKYSNSLGTDLTIGLLKDGLWCDASGDGLVNMPSYEIFSSPDYRLTNGIVYSSRPLIYNGCIIDEFWIKFVDGRAVEWDAKKGKEILSGMFNIDEHSRYLGECSLVNYDSPISNTNQVFFTTLIDENASCHLALGDGFTECFEADITDDDKLLEHGINVSKNHVDFMIGTSDMKIVGETFDGKVITIMENGNFVGNLVR